MNANTAKGEAVPRISEALAKRLQGRDAIDSIDFAMDMLRVVAVALTTPDRTALSEDDVMSAGYCVMNAVAALKVTRDRLNDPNSEVQP